jgi:hypothetical protein
MLPADVAGMLNITYEFDASRKHCPADAPTLASSLRS